MSPMGIMSPMGKNTQDESDEKKATRKTPSEARRRKIPTTGLEVLRAEARDVPTASSPSVREAGEARASAASAARPISAERSEAAGKRRLAALATTVPSPSGGRASVVMVATDFSNTHYNKSYSII